MPGLHLLARVQASGGGLRDLLWFHSGRAVEEEVMADLEALSAPASCERVVLAIEPGAGGAPSRARLARRLPSAFRRARAKLREHRSEVLLGLGGFATVPAVLAARSLGVPVALLEINAAPGGATRALARLAQRVLHAWPGTMPRAPGSKHRLVGAPVGPQFRPATPDEIASTRERLGFPGSAPLLVVLGGSQGAGALNAFVREHASRFASAGVRVVHQVGPGRAAEAAPSGASYLAVEYVHDVASLLGAADLVLCRGGASSLVEIAAVGVPAWVVPYPHHADAHQELNARELGRGVRVVAEENLGPEACSELGRLAGPAGAAERAAMRAHLHSLGRSDATGALLRELQVLARPGALEP